MSLLCCFVRKSHCSGLAGRTSRTATKASLRQFASSCLASFSIGGGLLAGWFLQDDSAFLLLTLLNFSIAWKNKAVFTTFGRTMCDFLWACVMYAWSRRPQNSQHKNETVRHCCRLSRTELVKTTSTIDKFSTSSWHEPASTSGVSSSTCKVFGRIRQESLTLRAMIDHLFPTWYISRMPKQFRSGFSSYSSLIFFLLRSVSGNFHWWPKKTSFCEAAAFCISGLKMRVDRFGGSKRSLSHGKVMNHLVGGSPTPTETRNKKEWLCRWEVVPWNSEVALYQLYQLYLCFPLFSYMYTVVHMYSWLPSITIANLQEQTGDPAAVLF